MVGLTRKGFVKALGLVGLAGLFSSSNPFAASKVCKTSKSVCGLSGLSWKPGVNSAKKSSLIKRKFGRDINVTY